MHEAQIPEISGALVGDKEYLAEEPLHEPVLLCRNLALAYQFGLW